MVVLKLDDLPDIRKRYLDKKIVFCSGVFDLTHAGHVLFFENCKELGDILVVGIGRAKLIKKEKNEERPILNDYLRIKMVDSLKPVDYTLFFQDLSKFEEEPYKSNTLAFLEFPLKKLKPDFYVVNEDASNIDYRINLCSKSDTRLYILKRNYPKEFEGISTTKIIEKIKSFAK